MYKVEIVVLFVLHNRCVHMDNITVCMVVRYIKYITEKVTQLNFFSTLFIKFMNCFSINELRVESLTDYQNV